MLLALRLLLFVALQYALLLFADRCYYLSPCSFAAVTVIAGGRGKSITRGQCEKRVRGGRRRRE